MCVYETNIKLLQIITTFKYHKIIKTHIANTYTGGVCMDDNIENQDILKLGGSIELSGFRSLNGGQMIILKKIVGNYARRFSDKSTNFELLHLHMKTVHERETSELFEIHAKLIDNGRNTSSQVTDRNVFVAVDSALKKIEEQ